MKSKHKKRKAVKRKSKLLDGNDGIGAEVSIAWNGISGSRKFDQFQPEEALTARHQSIS
jgi:hypothetical protein